MKTNQLAAVAASLAVALGAVACGDSSGAGGAGGAGTTATTTTTVATSTGTSMAQCANICMMYGAAVPTVAKDITEAAAADPKFMADFAPLVAKGMPAVQAFEVSLGNFISDAYGCSSGKYTGPTMQVAHMGMNITQAHYNDFVALIAGVLKKDGVAQPDIDNCFAPVLTDPGFSSTVIGK